VRERSAVADLDRIRGKCSASEAEELDVLQFAVVSTRQAYQDGYAESDLKKWNAAKVGLKEFTNTLVAKYFPAEQCFDTRLEAAQWLIDQGYKIKKSKFYADCKKGLCIIEHDNRVRLSEVDGYAARYLDRLEDEDGNQTPLTEEKTRLEIEKLKAQNERAQFELEKERKKYIPRRDFNLEMSSRVGVLDQGVQNFFRTRTADWVSAVGGDAKKVSMVLDMMLPEWNELLAEYASLEYFVDFEEVN